MFSNPTEIGKSLNTLRVLITSLDHPSHAVKHYIHIHVRTGAATNSFSTDRRQQHHKAVTLELQPTSFRQTQTAFTTTSKKNSSGINQNIGAKPYHEALNRIYSHQPISITRYVRTHIISDFRDFATRYHKQMCELLPRQDMIAMRTKILPCYLLVINN